MIEFKMPSLGADMDEAMLVGWLVAPGDRVARGDVIAEVETDKGIMEVECWDDGVIAELLVEPSSEKLPVGTPLARIGSGEPTMAESEPVSEPVEVREPVSVAARARTDVTRAPPHVVRAVAPPVRHLAHQLGVDITSVTPTGPDGSITRDDVKRAATRRRMSPRARRLAAERGVDPTTIEATGPEGMIVVADLAGARSASAETETPLPETPLPETPLPETPLPETSVPEMSGLERAGAASPEAAEPEPSDPALAMRRAIARSMARSNREIPQYSLVTQIDMKPALDWLSSTNADRSVTSRILPAALFAKATALALRDVPELNGHYENDGFLQADEINLGMAISLRTGGLVAPAIRNADMLTLDELMAALDDLVTRARSWKLRTSEMTSATATLTNLGERGVATAFPIVIPPQVAIIGLGRVMERPVAVDGMVAVRPTVDATLTADHRATDGHRGGLFLAALDRRLQEPEKL
jgi:pyruvate dehydrogenase E2 component (dihydrolipoamide acetyltransferase)